MPHANAFAAVVGGQPFEGVQHGTRPSDRAEMSVWIYS
jgi:hypothetical protein